MKPYANASHGQGASWNGPRSAGAHYLHAKYNTDSAQRRPASAEENQIVHRIREFRTVARLRHTTIR